MARNSKKLEDGREIIAREYNTEAPHPNPSQNGKLVPFHNVNKLLVLDPTDADNPDGITLYECDGCGKNYPTVKSVVSHMTAHADRGPEYPEDVIKTVLQLAVNMRATAGRAWGKLTADELNRRQVPTARGGRWSAGVVGHIFRAYLKTYPTRPTRRRTIVGLGAAASVPSTATSSPATVSEIRPRRSTTFRANDDASTTPNKVNTLYRVKVHTIADAVIAINHLAEVTVKLVTDAGKIAREVERLNTDVANAVAAEAAKAPVTVVAEIDPEIIEKAKLYDQFSGLFGGLIRNNDKK